MMARRRLVDEVALIAWLESEHADVAQRNSAAPAPAPVVSTSLFHAVPGFLYRCDDTQIARVREAAAHDGLTPEEMIKHIVDEWVDARLSGPRVEEEETPE